MIIKMIKAIGGNKSCVWMLAITVAVLEVFVLAPRPIGGHALIREIYSFVLGFAVCLIGISGVLHNHLSGRSITSRGDAQERAD